MGLFSKKTKTSLGIDVGTTAIKVVELEKEGERLKLINYGEIRAEGELREGPSRPVSLTMSYSEIAEMIREILRATKVSGKNATLSIPIFSAFITLIELPEMSEKELAQALPYEARQYVPVPIEEVTLDFSIVGKKTSKEGSPAKIEVLLVAVPNEIVSRMTQVAKVARFDLRAIEVESFGLARAVVGQDPTPICLVDIGARSSDIVIVADGQVRASHNFDTAGHHLSEALSRAIQISFERAEAIKQERGLKVTEGERDILEVITPLLDLIILEVQRVMADYNQNSSRKIEKVILSGGSAKLPGLKDYFAKFLGVDVSVASPFARLMYPKVLSPALEDIGPSFAVAVGLAMRGL